MSAEEVVDELRNRVEALESRVNELEEKAESGGLESKNTDMREFVNNIDPGPHTQRATTIGFYLEQNEHFDSFTSKDIEDGYVECKIAGPENMSDTLAGAEGRDWVMRVGESDEYQLWTLTQEGEAAVESSFNT